MRLILYTILALVIVAMIFAGYWYFFLRLPEFPDLVPEPVPTSGFQPFGRVGQTPDPSPTSVVVVATSTPVTIATTTIPKLPALRELSGTPVGGFGIFSTKSTTTLRWVDRGRGNVYEIINNSPSVTTLSNTIVPRIYESLWNQNQSAFIGAMLQSNDEPAFIYGRLEAQSLPKIGTSTPATTTPTSLTPFVLKGRNLPDGVLAYAVSPKGDRVFLLVNENDRSIGYVSSFDGRTTTRIFDTPMSQVVAEWPEENIIAITTKASASQEGYLYFVNPKTGVWKKILGPQRGLTTKVSRDGKKVFYSTTGSESGVRSFIYTVSSGISLDAVIRTFADKCTWGNLHKDIVYCGVPIQWPPGARYPDDWYKGLVTLTDKIWQVSATTAEIELVSDLLSQAKQIIDVYNMNIDNNDNYLVFMNKEDLSLWQLDLLSVR